MSETLADRARVERLRALRHRIAEGDFAAIDEHNALTAPPLPCPVVPVVLGRAGVHLIARELVPPELLPERWSDAAGGYR